MNKYLFIALFAGFATSASAQSTPVSSKKIIVSNEKAEVMENAQQETESEDVSKTNEMMKKNAVFNTKNETPPAEGNGESPAIISTNKKKPN